MMQSIGWINLLALAWLIFLWVGYDRFAHYMARHSRNNLSFEMNSLRKCWMMELLKRDLRIADATLIANLERNVSFLASSSKLVILGLIAAMAATDSIQRILASIPFSLESSVLLINFKLIVLAVIYTYAFFTASWSMRQYGFVTVMIGAAPMSDKCQENPDLMASFVKSGAKLIDMAGHTYNNALRAYYFSLSVLAWFFSPLLFMVAITAVVVVLYIREFHSRPLKELRLLTSSYLSQ